MLISNWEVFGGFIFYFIFKETQLHRWWLGQFFQGLLVINIILLLEETTIMSAQPIMRLMFSSSFLILKLESKLVAVFQEISFFLIKFYEK